MTSTSKFASWYTAGDAAQHSLARQAFDDAVAEFSSELSKDADKAKWLRDPSISNINAVLSAVLDAQNHYNERKGDSKTRDALDSLAEKIHHYSGLVDVFVSHHPEYTALVWGAIKFLFVGVTNHQKLLSRLSEALTEIANTLPRAQLLLQLYPTQYVYSIVVAIYASILRFLIRALGWYKESKFKHVLHSITRPVELRYNDILARIAALSRSLTETAWAGSHAEQRDMHINVQKQLQAQQGLQKSICQLPDQLAEKQLQTQQNLQESVNRIADQLAEIQKSLAASQALKDCAKIDSQQTLDQGQLLEFLSQMSVSQISEPHEALQASLFLARRRLAKPSQRGPAFWTEKKIQEWNQSRNSSYVVINGTWKQRAHLQKFCALSIEALQAAQIPALWALSSTAPNSAAAGSLSTIDLIRYLVVQAVKLNLHLQTDAALAPCSQTLHTAKTEDDWLRVLATVLEGIPFLYLILDLNILHQSSSDVSVIGSWPRICEELFGLLNGRGAGSILRVALVTYGSTIEKRTLGTGSQGSMVAVGGLRQPAASRSRCQRFRSGPATSSPGSTLELSRLSLNAATRSRKGRGLRAR